MITIAFKRNVSYNALCLFRCMDGNDSTLLPHSSFKKSLEKIGKSWIDFIHLELAEVSTYFNFGNNTRLFIVCFVASNYVHTKFFIS